MKISGRVIAGNHWRGSIDALIAVMQTPPSEAKAWVEPARTPRAAELFPEKRQREIMLGSTQAFASLGGVLITAMSAWILIHAEIIPGDHSA